MSTSDQSDIVQLAKEIGDLYLNESFSDVTIVIDGTELPAHRMILSQRCPYFKTMFSSGMIESTSKRIELRETPINGFKSVLKWIYTGVSEFADISTALEVFRLSDMYQLKKLESKTSNYISDNCGIDNFCLILNSTALRSLGYCLIYDFLEESGVDVLTHETFLNLSKDSMKLMLDYLPADLTNVEILEALVRWMKANSDQSEHFLDLLKLVPLNSMVFGELSSIVPSELVTAKDLMEVGCEQQFMYENGQIKDTNFASAKYGAKVTIDNKHVFMSKRFLDELTVDTDEVVIDLRQRVKLNTFSVRRVRGYSEIGLIDIFVSTDEANWTCVVDQRNLVDTFGVYHFDERVVRFIRICGELFLNEVLKLDTFSAYYA